MKSLAFPHRELDISAAWVWLAEARLLLNRLAYRVLFCLHPLSGYLLLPYPDYAGVDAITRY